MALEMQGQVGCLVEVLQTSIAVVTQSRSNRTVIKTVPTVLTSTITSIPQKRTSSAKNFLEGTAYVEGTFSPSGPPSRSFPSSTVVSTEPTTEAASMWGLPPSVTTLDQTAFIPVTRPVSQPTVDGVFVNSAPKLVTPLAGSVTVSLVSTLTILGSLSAGCGASDG